MNFAEIEQTINEYGEKVNIDFCFEKNEKTKNFVLFLSF